jgi:hypothetical protein
MEDAPAARACDPSPRGGDVDATPDGPGRCLPRVRGWEGKTPGGGYAVEPHVHLPDTATGAPVTRMVESPQSEASRTALMATVSTNPVDQGAPLFETGAETGHGGRWRLFTLSLLLLFLELALIRWTAANNVYLASLTNFVLLATFLGIGVGFLLGRSRVDLFRWAPLVLAALIAFGLLCPVKLVALKGPHEFQGLPGHHPIPEWISLTVTFCLSALVMAGVGQGMARTFGRFRPLEAYRLDIAGSIAGIVLFSVLSLVGLPPIVWGLVVSAAFVVLGGRHARFWQWLPVAAVVVMLLVESLSSVDVWSPYYKITAFQPRHTHGVLVVSGNNVPYQTLYPLSTLHAIESFYFFPYKHVTRAELRRVLVIGAGTGNDVGVALAEGARHVDAVEIDPDLVALGKRYNPEHAYQSRRVSIHIDDGRAFVQDTTTKYSLILYALPDSLTALTGQAAPVGLENYLLTTEAAEQARAHLTRDGVFSMYNYYQPFLLDRYATMLEQVFGTPPCVQLGNTLSRRAQAVLTEKLHGTTPHCRTLWHGKALAPVSDDRPFPYLPTPSIPTFYLWVVGIILAGSVLVVRAAGGRFSRMGRFADLFCMGAAFMLLESKNIVQFALLFGTTWYVNSIVFAGVLVSVYLAIETARHVQLPRPILLYAALLVALAVSWVVPGDTLLSLPIVARFAAATAVAFAPIFLANLVFAQRFEDVAASTVAFGANLLGAMAGGVLEYLSLMTGFRFLLVLVALLYAAAFLLGRRAIGRVPT